MLQRPTFSHLSDRLPATLEAGDRADTEFSGVRVESSEGEEMQQENITHRLNRQQHHVFTIDEKRIFHNFNRLLIDT